MNDFYPVVGDDNPYFSCKLREMPTGFHLTDIEIDYELHPKTYIFKDKFLGMAERYYRNFEVNAITPMDFKENVQLSYDLNADVFETMLDKLPFIDNIMIGNTVIDNLVA